MKILTNKNYDDLLKQIKQGMYVQKDFQKEKKSLNDEIDELQITKHKLLDKNAELLNDIEKLSLKCKILNEEKLILDEKFQESKKIVSEYLEKLKSATGRIGGLQKENNKLKSGLVSANEKLENFSKHCKLMHMPLTVNQYDKRLKPSNKKRK